MQPSTTLVWGADSPRYIEIRKYTAPPEEIDEIMRRVQNSFLPIVSRLPGFRGYYAMNLGRGLVLFANIFDTAEGARQSNVAAAEWVAEGLADLNLLRTDVTEGQVTFAAERWPEAVAEPTLSAA